MTRPSRPEAVPWSIRRFAQGQGLRPELVPAHRVEACRQLIHRVYHQEMGWTPPAGNPSGLRLVDGPTPQMVDVFDESALWLGVYRGTTLVACTRVILPLHHPALEVALYHAVPESLLAGAMEVNRLAIARERRDGWTFAVIALMLWWIGRHYRVERALLAAEEPLSRKLYRPLGWQFTGQRFRYHDSDPHACELLALEPRGAAVAAGLGKTLVRSLARAVGGRRGDRRRAAAS